jgi:hypothetical protein
MPREPSPQALPEMSDQEFVDAVVDLYNRILKDQPEEPGTKIPEDVAAVAFPLATLGGAVDLLAERVTDKPEPGKVKRSAVIPTMHLFDALLTGAVHPFWRYARIMRSPIAYRKPPTKAELARRTIAVGLLRALMAALGPRSEHRAGIMIQTACLKRGMNITARQLNEWNTEFQTARDPEPDRVAQRLHGKPGADTHQILSAGVNNLDEFFGRLRR